MPAAARRAVEGLADRLGLDLNAAAEGILTVINANMANAIRSRTVQKGIDPRGFALVAFGGAGPLHGAEVAAMLEIPEVIVPPYPGITSAMGLLTTDLKYDVIRTQFQVSGSVDLNRLNADLTEMEAELAKQFDADRVPVGDVTFQPIGDLRYVGQGYELKIPFPAGTLTAAGLGQVWQGLPRGACGRIRPCLSVEPDRDRQHPGERHRPHPENDRAGAALGRQPRQGADPDRRMRVPRRRQARIGADRLLSAEPAAGRRQPSRSGDRATEGLAPPSSRRTPRPRSTRRATSSSRSEPSHERAAQAG